MVWGRRLDVMPCFGGAETSDNLHKVALEELLQPLLSCRVGQITDVEAATLSRAGGTGIGRLVRDGGVGQSGSHVVDGSVSGLILLGRHFGWLIVERLTGEMILIWSVWCLGGVSQLTELGRAGVDRCGCALSTWTDLRKLTG